MNVLTGIYRPTAGSVTLARGQGTKRLDGRTPSEIADSTEFSLAGSIFSITWTRF